MPAQWSWILADDWGSNLCELATASGRSLSFKRNYYSEAQLTLSHEDDAAYLLLDALANTGIPTLKCYRRRSDENTGTLRFNGYLAGLQEDAEEESTITATFRSPFAFVLGDGSTRGDYLTAPVSYVATDAGFIADDLRTRGESGLAILTSAAPFELTKNRDRTYEAGTNVGQAIINLTNVLDGFDFAEHFIDRPGRVRAELNVFARQGVEQPTVKFEYGPGTLANVRSVSRTTLPPINDAYVSGGNGLVGRRFDIDSVVTHFPLMTWTSATEVTEQATLDDKAQALLRPNPVKTIQFTPEFGLDNCPKPWDDFWLGDTVRFLARRGALYENTTVRVNGIKVVVDENGIETAEVEDPTMPEEDAYIRANIDVEVGV